MRTRPAFRCFLRCLRGAAQRGGRARDQLGLSVTSAGAIVLTDRKPPWLAVMCVATRDC